MNIGDLPVEIQNNIFYFSAEHPCAKLIKIEFNDLFKKSYEKYDYDSRYVKIGIPIESLYNKYRLMFSMEYFTYRNGETLLKYV